VESKSPILSFNIQILTPLVAGSSLSTSGGYDGMYVVSFTPMTLTTIIHPFLWTMNYADTKPANQPGIAIDRLVDVIGIDRPSTIDQSTINQTV
jgi:hypothetical protein